MAGNDSTAHSFAAKFQPAATAIVEDIGDAGQGLALTASKLLVMAVNYLEIDNAAAGRMGAKIDIQSPMRTSMQDCDPNEAYAALPMAARNSSSSDRPVLAYHVTGHRIQLIDF